MLTETDGLLLLPDMKWNKEKVCMDLNGYLSAPL
jgi:hypothetical protein